LQAQSLQDERKDANNLKEYNFSAADY